MIGQQMHMVSNHTLAFLDGMYASSEFAEYNPKADEYSDFIRSYMEVSLSQFNPD